MSHILEADGIQLGLEGRRILSDVYLKCETGKITGLLGRNGQGKSCLMKIINGNLKCEKSVRVDNISIYKSNKQHELLHYLPQFNFIPKTLSLKKIFRNFELDFTFFKKQFPEFEANYNFPIYSMSGGERRLIELYVVIKSRTLFAMLDEPFTHLSPIQVEKVKDLLISEKGNKGFLITDHMYKHIMDISDSLYILKNGKTHLTKNPIDIETYGYAML